ncbi:MAG: conjugative transfer ATPase, partial [Gammaproteobacteria bacterium]|nr:conjugative transfer ATPase [Gammaproteobacteria bacterium]
MNPDSPRPVHEPAVRTASVHRQYARPPSFTDLLPWMEYLPDLQAFVLEDGISLGALFEIEPTGCEARTPAFMQALRDSIQTALCEAVPEHDEAPWILQVYVQDEPSLEPFARMLADYPAPDIRATQYCRQHQDLMEAHLQAISGPQGLFTDDAVTGSRWRGQVRRVRAVLYRRLGQRARLPSAVEVEEALSNVATRWVASLESCGIRAVRTGGQALYEWLLPWFNPKPELASDAGAGQLLKLAPYPGDGDLPFGHDLAEQLTLSMPRSDSKEGAWYFDGLAHTVVSLQHLRRVPQIGHFTAERIGGDRVYSLFDRLPEHTVMALTLTFRPQDTTRNHIARIRRASVGDSAEATLTREDAEQVEREMARSHKVYPTSLAFYVRGEDGKALRTRLNELNALLLPNGLQPITREGDLLALDSYIRNLPMAHDEALDRRRRRSRLVFSRHIANLVPFYGRSRGTGHPGLVFFNRGAEPLVFDPLHRDDRKKNAHMLILGPTGAGKSALLVWLLQQMCAVYRPRMFIIEAGGSFSLLGEYFRAHEVSVHAVVLNPDSQVSLPPFADALRLLDTPARSGSPKAGDSLPGGLSGGGRTGDEEEGASGHGATGRDVLGEMEIAARVMITGGDAGEDARMSRADRLLIRDA